MMPPRYYQQQAHDAVWDYLRNTSGNPIVVLPTGAGKSLLAAMLVRQALEFDARVMLIQHRKELIEQNAEKIRLLLPGVPVGINSAGLRRHAFDEDVICGGIQTIYKRASEFGRRELVVIDEAHLIGTDSDSMYGQFVHDLKQLNPKSRFVGLTATPYRTGEGPICRPDKLFQRICYEVQTGDLIREGWLSPLINKAADSSVDTSAIKQRGGEFLAGDMEKTFDDDCKTEAACREIITRTTYRKSVLLFCSGVAHADHVAAAIADMTGEEVGIVTGETFAMERQRILSDFKSGRLRWCVNVDVLTTGFDSPRIDAIAVLRATMSPGLFAQIVGRGLRKHESKTDCLILDFGENIKRHGSLDDPEYGRASVGRGGSGGGTREGENNGRGKQCPNCGLDVAARSVTCPECGLRFPANHDQKPDEESTITGQAPPEVWQVVGVTWNKHQKRNDPDAPPTLRVNYECQPANSEPGNLTLKHISEWVCLEHQGFAWRKACQWWEARSVAPVPVSIDDALYWLNKAACRMPAEITTTREGKYYRITACRFCDEIPDPDDYAASKESEQLVNEFGEEVPF